MDREEIKNLIKEIIKEELSEIKAIDKFLFKKNIQIFDNRHIQTGRTNGTKIGTATDQKISFYGTTPVSQQSAISDPSGGVTIDSNCRSTVNDIIDVLENLGLIAN